MSGPERTCCTPWTFSARATGTHSGLWCQDPDKWGRRTLCPGRRGTGPLLALVAPGSLFGPEELGVSENALLAAAGSAQTTSSGRRRNHEPQRSWGVSAGECDLGPRGRRHGRPPFTGLRSGGGAYETERASTAMAAHFGLRGVPIHGVPGLAVDGVGGVSLAHRLVVLGGLFG